MAGVGRVARQVLAWVPAVVLVPAGLAALVQATAPDDEQNELAELHPLEKGTTWVYRVFDHGDPSGTRVRQVETQAAVALDQLDAVLVRSSYTDYPGQGARTDGTYLGLTDDALLQYGVHQNGEYVEVTPPAPSYELPLTEGRSWRWEGTIGEVEATIDSELAAFEDVEVSGRTFTDCARFVTELEFTPQGSKAAVVEHMEEWTCPGIGAVRLTDTLEEFGVEIVEELVAVAGPQESWTAAGAEDLVAEATGGEPETTEPVAGSTLGFDAARSNAVDGELSNELAWSDARSLDGAYPPVSDGRTMVLGQDDGEVSATDVHTGELRWRLRLTGPVAAPPLVAGGVALVADGAKQLWALDLDDGSARWVHTFDDVVHSSPVATDDTVVVATDDGQLTALSLEDGAERWDRLIGVRTRSALALAETAETSVVVVGDPDGQVLAFDLAGGDHAWTHGLEGGLEVGPAAADGQVLVADNGGVVYALDAADGHALWESRTRYDPTGAFALADGLAVVLGGSERLEAFDLADGSKEWSEEIPETVESPVVVGAEAVTVGVEGQVVQRDLASGSPSASWQLPVPTHGSGLELDVAIGTVGQALVFSGGTGGESQGVGLWAYPLSAEAERRGVWLDVEVRATPTSPNSPPLLAGDTLYLPGLDGALYRLGAAGRPEPVHQTKSLQPAPVVHEGLLLAQRDRQLVAYSLDDGSEQWTFPMADPFPGSVPAAHGQTVFVPQYGVGLAAVDTSGRPLWATPIPNALASTSPLALPDGDVVYGSGALARYDGATGEQLWAIEGAQVFGPLAQADGMVFANIVPDTSETGLVAVDAETGEVLWTHRNDWPPVSVGPAAGDGVVVFADRRGDVVALDAASGEVLWTVHMSSPPAGSPVILDGRVYLAELGRAQDFSQRDYRLSAHDLHTGAFLGALQPPGQDIIRTPSVTASEGRLLLPAVSFRGSTIQLLEPQG